MSVVAFLPTRIPSVIQIIPHVLHDDRGYFFESFRASSFNEAGISEPFVQENQSYSVQHTLRGLHFQNPPHAQSKCITCLVGRIFDVTVDLRNQSETFGQWVGCELSSEAHNSLYIPQGFAHGFLVLSEFAVVSYKCGAYYNRESEGSLRWDDPTIQISWPIPAGQTPLLSEKDQIAPLFSPHTPYFQ